MLRTIFGAHSSGSSPEPVAPQDKIVCGIHLDPCEATKIRGKVQIVVDTILEHYGLVVEFDGRIQLAKGEAPIKLFEPHPETVNESSIYQLVQGRPEALGKNLSPQQMSRYRKRLRPTSPTFEFFLPIPASLGSLPPSLATNSADVIYNIIVYRRTLSGYLRMTARRINFYGNRVLPEAIYTMEPRPSLEFGVKGICCSLKTCKRQYLANEPVKFSLSAKTMSKCFGNQINDITISLWRVIKVHKKGKKVDVLERVVPKKFSKTDEFVVKGVFRNRKLYPSYDDHGLKISYFLKCEIDCGFAFSVIRKSLELIVGTSRAQSPASFISSENDWMRGRAPSRISTLSELTLSLPNYSNLSSRAASDSALSFETLPPHYDDLPKEERKTLESESGSG